MRTSPYWKFKKSTLELECRDYPSVFPYCVDLETCTTEAECKDWIEHIGKKTWGHPYLLEDLKKQLKRWIKENEKRPVN